jgi:hypothetical protein
MARLRRVGNAFADTGALLLQHVLRLKQQQNESSLVQQRQQELAELQNEFRRAQQEDAQANQEHEAVLGDPTGAKAEMLVKGGKAQYSGFVPDPEVATTRYGAKLNDISERAKLPGDLGLEMGLGATPGGAAAAKDPTKIEQLIAQRNGRRGVIDEAALAASADKQRDASATSYGTAMGTEQAATENFPAVLGRKKDEFNALTPLEVSRAGKVAGAQASARNAADLAQLEDPRWLRAQAEKIRQEGVARALANRSEDHAKMINEAATAVASITPDWEKMVILSKKVNTGDMGQPGTYYLASKLQTNKDASELDSIGANLAKRLANNPLFGGNKGAQSEKDSEAISNRLPNSYDSKKTAERKIRDFNSNLYTGLKAMSELPATASPQDKINKMRESIGLPPIDLANPPDPTTGSSALDQKWDLFLQQSQGQAPGLAPVPTHRRQ